MVRGPGAPGTRLDGREREVNERRHDTSAPFSKAEVARIREAVLTPGAPVVCPRCESPLTLDHPAATGPNVWWVHCASCQRNLIVRAPTEPSQTDTPSGEGELRP